MTQRVSPVSARQLRSLRETSGLSQAELASESGYCLKTIQRWEGGLGTPRKSVLGLLTSRLNAVGRVGADGRAFKFIDLFAGIGGTRLGFEKAGGRCVFTCERDTYAQKTYRANFGQAHPIFADITELNPQNIPAHDVLVAGFPCQPFSIAGVSKKNALGRPHGFACEAQGTLFFNLAEILRSHMPQAFLLENVKNLKTHDGGNTFSTIKKVLEEDLHYHVQTRIIDARAFVPQHRERVFIIGFREPTDFDLQAVALPVRETWPTMKSVLHSEDGSGPVESPYTDEAGRAAAKYGLTRHLWKYLQSYADKHRAKGNGFGFGLVGPDDVARTLSARYYKDGAEILVKRKYRTPRRLTPRECSRLMGFDSVAGKPFTIPVSDTQAYKQFGNSVAVPVIEAIATSLSSFIVSECGGHDPQLLLPLGATSSTRRMTSG